MPEDIAQSESRHQTVKEVVLVFALPMDEAGVTARPDTHAVVFAFLPVGTYGFRWVARDGLIGNNAIK